MKHSLLYIFFLLLSLTYSKIGFGQVKVGDNPETINASSLLELESADKGILMPRVALTSTAAAGPLASHVQGMLVYNTASAGSGSTAVTPGFYYNSGTAWIRMISGDDSTGDGLGNHTATEELVMGGNVVDFTESHGEKIDYWGGTYTVEVQSYELRTNSGGFHSWYNDESESMRLTEDGNLGIGLTTPTEKLDIAGKTRTTNFQMTSGAALNHVLQSDSNGNALWVDPASLAVTGDNLGDHTATTDLEMSNQNILNANFIRSGDTGAEGTVSLGQGTDSQSGFIEFRKADDSRNGFIGWDNNHMYYRAESGANHVFSGGDVGIGTSNPTTALDVEGSGRFENTIYIDDHNNNSPGSAYFSPIILFRGNGGATGGSVGFTNGENAIKLRARTSTGAVDLQTSAGIGLRVTSEGNIGIGTTTPDRKLTVSGTTPIRTINLTSSTGDQTGTLKHLTVDENGDFGVHTISPAETDNNLTPVTNGGSGSVPGNATSFGCYDGNWVSNVTLPTVSSARAEGWQYGEIMVIRRASTPGVTVNTDNTDLGGSLAIPSGTSVGFALGFERWYRVF